MTHSLKTSDFHLLLVWNDGASLESLLQYSLCSVSNNSVVKTKTPCEQFQIDRIAYTVSIKEVLQASRQEHASIPLHTNGLSQLDGPFQNDCSG